MMRRTCLGLLLALLTTLALPIQAHHGWTGGETIEIEGTITATRLGNPHGELTLDVAGEAWTVEVGQPWRNTRAGLEDGALVEGVELRVSGEHAGERLMKAEQLWIGEEHFVLYPGRI